ncbi:XVIPCD domain-containing protein [Lysobacter fragariae]
MSNDLTPEAQVAPEPLPRYRLIQKGHIVNIPVTDFDSLVTHHPDDNIRASVVNGVVISGERGRRHAVIGGEIQEIEVRTAQRTYGLTPDQVLLKKDFMLEDSRIASGAAGVRNVDVPAPLAGYIGDRNDAEGRVDIYDREGGEVIARVRHMRDIAVNVGDTIQYGQSLGTQGSRQTPKIHVHMEVDTRYYQQYENYLQDLVDGRLSIDPARRTAGIEAREVVDDGIIRIGESSDMVRRVQQRLNAEGFRGMDGRVLQEDGVYRLSMQAAVINYQAARGLPQTGDIDPGTLRQIAPRMVPPEVNPEGRGNDARPPWPPQPRGFGDQADSNAPRDHAHPLFAQAESAMRRLDGSLGKDYDGVSACMAASAACLARTEGLSRIDHIVLSVDSGAVRRGENLFVVQGDLGDPRSLVAQMKTRDAQIVPLEQSLTRLQAPGAPVVKAEHMDTPSMTRMQPFRTA